MSKKIEVSSATVEAVQAAILSHFDLIIDAERAANRDSCANQFKRERTRYENAAFVAAFCTALNISSADSFAFMLNVDQTNKRIAIYAMQKVTKLLRCAVENFKLASADKYTRAIIANAKLSENSIDNFDARASIAQCLKVSDDSRFSVRLHCADSTASTQRSSSSLALHSLQLAVYDRSQKTLTFDKRATNFKFARKLLDSIKSVSEANEMIREESEE